MAKEKKTKRPKDKNQLAKSIVDRVTNEKNNAEEKTKSNKK